MALKTDRQKMAHILRRFGLGASESELEWYLKDGFSNGIDLLINYEKVQADDPISLAAFKPDNNNNIPMPLVQVWWGTHLLTTQRPLQEKMVLFWHDHFATSAQKVNGSILMARQIDIFRENATADFRTILTNVSKDPAMLFWLDNQFNVKGKPNENFAREIMELFTLGVGNYTEKDVQEAARAFTGWTIRRARGQDLVIRNGKIPPAASFFFDTRQHDAGTKDILNNKGTFDGDDVIGILCGNPQTAKYITLKIWEWFAYPNPEPALVDRLAKNFRDSGLQMKVLLKSVMEAPEFYSEKAERSVYKNPMDFCIASLRQLGVGQRMKDQGLVTGDEEPKFNRAASAPVQASLQSMKAMGMEILFPPDVAGWEHGPSWVSSATMVERMGWADRLFPVTAPTPAGQTPVRSRKAVIRYPIADLISEDPTPKHLVDTLLSVLDVELPEAKKTALLKAAEKIGSRYSRADQANTAANSVCKMIFGSPEFQFC